MFVDVHEVKHNELLRAAPSHSISLAIQKRVCKARAIEFERYSNAFTTNGSMDNKQIKKYAQLSEPAALLLNSAAHKLKISARNYMRLIKVSRTIADLENSRTIEVMHMSEALQYRRKQRNFQ